MDIYKEVNDLNESVIQSTGRNLAPKIQYVVDENVKSLPKRQPAVPVRSAPAPLIRKSEPPAQIVPDKIIEKVPLDKQMAIVKSVNKKYQE